MDRNSLKQFRLDRRLIDRGSWISEKELALELEKLPDVSHKMTRLGEVADRVKSEAGAAANTAAEAPPPSPSAPESPQPE
jgi:hypothetical protein